MSMLWIPPKQLNVLLEILSDYLRMVGADPDRAQRIKTATKLLKQWSIGQ
jgi:hypothetical protein